MRFLLINHIQNAYQSLRSSRVRSFLTMLGVTIGVASVTAILSLSSGASKLVLDQVNSLGGNIAIIRPGSSDNNPLSDLSQLQNSYSTSTLTETDVAFISAVDHIQAIAPMMILSGNIKADSVAPSGSQILATTPDFFKTTNLELREGQVIDTTMSVKTAVIGTQLAINTFGTEFASGRIINIRGQKFTVVGVLKRINNPISYNGIDFDNTAIIDFKAGQEINQRITQIQQINIKADSVENIEDVADKINEILMVTHKNEKDFQILHGDQIAKPTSALFYAIASVSTAIAAISLIVGGIGIMNIMLVTVAERTREIGIRKALGASNFDITWQFLIESLSISITGGIAGYTFGYVIAFILSRLMSFYPVLTWEIATIAIAVSITLGTIFGLYPALRASRKDPVEALQQYS